MANGPNLFARLHKWAYRQDENFLTESLAIVLEQLLFRVPDVGAQIVSRITGGFIDLTGADASAIEIRTQIEAVSGRPDLEISTPHRLAWVEVKAESGLRTGQLEGYRVLLGERGTERTQLVLLSRYREQYTSSAERPDFELRWFEIADWLDDALPVLDSTEVVAGFVVWQFLEFLRSRNMTLAQVGKYMPEGARALSSLLNMLNESASAQKILTRLSADWESLGLQLGGKKYWIGVNYSEPEKLWFGTRCKIDADAAARLGVGELSQENWVPGRNRWWRSIQLDSEEVHFFSRSKVSQMEFLEHFLRECVSMAKSIETQDQPPIPDDSGTA